MNTFMTPLIRACFMLCFSQIQVAHKEKFMWTTIGTDILIYVVDPNLLGLRL